MGPGPRMKRKRATCMEDECAVLLVSLRRGRAALAWSVLEAIEEATEEAMPRVCDAAETRVAVSA